MVAFSYQIFYIYISDEVAYLLRVQCGNYLRCCQLPHIVILIIHLLAFYLMLHAFTFILIF